MTDPKFQAIWHEMNEAQVSLVLASEETDKSKCGTLLVESQRRAKNADTLIKDLFAEHFKLSDKT